MRLASEALPSQARQIAFPDTALRLRRRLSAPGDATRPLTLQSLLGEVSAEAVVFPLVDESDKLSAHSA